jgi:hypothetical protein
LGLLLLTVESNIDIIGERETRPLKQTKGREVILGPLLFSAFVIQRSVHSKNLCFLPPSHPRQHCPHNHAPIDVDGWHSN